jgi:uncharacterized protein YdhG (YjbR/CyaY superfamily)
MKTKSSSTTKQQLSISGVDAYLSSAPPEFQSVLDQVRNAIRSAAPKAEEVISYQIPTYKQNGPLVHFKWGKKYCSFIVVSLTVIQKFKDELESFELSGRTIHFSNEHPLPPALVKKIVKTRIKENEEIANKKK